MHKMHISCCMAIYCQLLKRPVNVGVKTICFHSKISIFYTKGDWKHTIEVINWFKKFPDEKKLSFSVFDMANLILPLNHWKTTMNPSGAKRSMITSKLMYPSGIPREKCHLTMMTHFGWTEELKSTLTPTSAFTMVQRLGSEPMDLHAHSVWDFHRNLH